LIDRVIGSENERDLSNPELNLNLQCVVMKNAEVVLIDNFVEKSGGKYIL
jgi:hypothetical protein